MKKLEFESPWAVPDRDECLFYHKMTFPDGEIVPGIWEIPSFKKYIGSYKIKGKTVLDIGTATGYLAFSAENAGASEVTGFDIKNHKEQRLIPFAGISQYPPSDEKEINKLKKSWWYGWHKNKSNAKCIYAPIENLYECEMMYDIVIAGAVVDHISDPVFAIGAWAKVAREAVIIPFVPVIFDDDLLMKPLTGWDNPSTNFAWWHLSSGLYKRVFSNLNFSVDFSKSSTAIYNDPEKGFVREKRPTIIAKRQH